MVSFLSGLTCNWSNVTEKAEFREACARQCELTMEELIKQNKALEFDLTGLKV